MDGVYLTWLISALAIGVLLMPIVKPPWAKVTLHGFIDFLRRYWLHIGIVLVIYNAKDFLDEVDRILMANTDGMLNMTPWIYAIEGDMSLWVQETFMADWLTAFMTHFYVMGFMTATFSSFIYPIFFDDRYMADRVSLSMFWVYILAIPFYLFLNVKVTGNYVEGMETIAYDLTPEIHNWFNRIDPFTNGMPSLHIGLPFAIWLSMHRWDEDGRWKKFRTFLILFIGLTSVSIVYLGIHWFVDIIGGMIIAILAVNITAKTHEPIWRIADERLFTRRLARTLEDPRGSLQRTLRSCISALDPVREPGKNQTGAIIMSLIILTGSVILWDVTHQKISIEEADSPTSASGSGEWLVWVEESEDGVEITAGNVTSLTNRTVGGQHWIETPEVVSSGGSFVIFNNNSVEYFEHNQESGVLQPIFEESLDEGIVDIAILTDSNGVEHLAILSPNDLQLVDTSDKSTEFVELNTNSSVLASSGALVAISEKSEAGPLVNITSIDSDLTISIPLDPRSSERIEDSIMNSGTILDFQNSTIVDLVMDSNWLVATVDVGPFNRTVLVDTLSINQTFTFYHWVDTERAL